MNAPVPTNVVFPDDNQRHKALETIDALLNLVYLVRLDASEPAQVAAYAEQCEQLLLGMRAQMSAAGGRKSEPAVAASRPKVLVVDDEPTVARTLALIFSNAGYETRAAGSAEQALELLKVEAWVPQLAILDVHLPGMNGIDLAVMLKANYPNVRLTLFSGRAETTGLLEEAQRQGHLFHALPKPVHPTVFLETAARLLSEPDPGTDETH